MAPSVHQYIRISGQAHERGVAYGSFAKERILKVIDEYKVLFDKEAHLPWKDAVPDGKTLRTGNPGLPAGPDR